MKSTPIGPLAGIDNFSARDDALQVGGNEPRVYLREANNVTITNGRASMRPGLRPVTSTPYADLWQSPLHGDTFARLGAQRIQFGQRRRVDPIDFTVYCANAGHRAWIVAQTVQLIIGNAVIAQPLSVSHPVAVALFAP